MKHYFLGFIFMVALVAFGFGTLLIEDISLSFDEPPRITIHFEDVRGLQAGNEVKVEGVPFGKVETMTLLPDGGVAVVARLDGEIVLYQDAVVLIDSASVLGGNHIAIDRGGKGDPKDLTQPVVGTARPGFEEIGEMVAENRPGVKDLIEKAEILARRSTDRVVEQRPIRCEIERNIIDDRHSESAGRQSDTVIVPVGRLDHAGKVDIEEIFNINARVVERTKQHECPSTRGIECQREDTRTCIARRCGNLRARGVDAVD